MSDPLPDGVTLGPDGTPRCAWGCAHADYVRYHDLEWGTPVADDTRLFEKLCLEGFQSGLSWLTILRKRENFRRAFAGFDIPTVAAFTEADVASLLADAGVVRHRAKIQSAINNARRAQALQAEFGSLARFVWRFEPEPERGRVDLDYYRRNTTSDASRRMAQELKKRGWTFVGPTTLHAFAQSMGLLNDHLEGCACRSRVEAARAAFARP